MCVNCFRVRQEHQDLVVPLELMERKGPLEEMEKMDQLVVMAKMGMLDPPDFLEQRYRI